MKIIYLLTVVVIACVFALTNQSVNEAQAQPIPPGPDIVLLRCDSAFSPPNFLVVTDTRSLAAGAPTAFLSNCAQALATLLDPDGFKMVEVLGSSFGGGFIIILNR